MRDDPAHREPADERRPRAPSHAIGGGSVAVAATATMATVLATLPVFLLGALASLVRAELQFDEAALGLLAGTFFGAAAVASVPAGRLAERIGARRGLQIGIALAMVSLVGTAVAARSWSQLIPLVLMGGAANGIIQPSTNLGLARGVTRERQGIAFGAKQGAVPVATLLAGLAVPLVGLTVGWRWAFAGAALLALPLSYAVTRSVPATLPVGPDIASASAGPAVRSVDRLASEPSLQRGLLLVAVAGGCGAAAGNAMGAFYVESAVVLGHPLPLAGALFSVGSVSGVLARVTTGWLADRLLVDQFRVVAGMMVVGALGFLAVGRGAGLALLVPATVVGFMAGWGWPGLLQLSIVRENMHAPAAASGITQTGVYLGGVLGPVVFGSLVRAAGYPTAWAAAAGSAALGGLLLWIYRRQREGVDGRHVAEP